MSHEVVYTKRVLVVFIIGLLMRRWRVGSSSYSVFKENREKRRFSLPLPCVHVSSGSSCASVVIGATVTTFCRRKDFR